jgi:hypothetical protein
VERRVCAGERAVEREQHARRPARHAEGAYALNDSLWKFVPREEGEKGAFQVERGDDARRGDLASVCEADTGDAPVAAMNVRCFETKPEFDSRGFGRRNQGCGETARAARAAAAGGAGAEEMECAAGKERIGRRV